jgi:hypothetical protein
LDTEPQCEAEAPKGDEKPLSINEVVPEQAAIEPIRDAKELTTEEELASEPVHQQSPTEVQIAQQPLLVHVTKDDELSTFERRTVFFGIVGIFLATLSMVAAATAGIFIYQQFKEMQYANTLSGIAARRARYDSDKANIATAKQLAVLQTQLTQQRNALEMDQRPWLKFELGGERPKDVDPNNSKSRLLTTTVGQPIKIEVRVTNIGKTTAEKIFGTLIVQYVPKGGKPILPKRENRIVFTEGTKPEKGALPGTAWGEPTIYPNEVSQNSFSRSRWGKNGTIEDDPISQTEKTELDNGNAYVLLLGEVWYSDVFGVRHWTKFCEISSQLDLEVAKKCLAFGTVDSSLPKAGDRPKAN